MKEKEDGSQARENNLTINTELFSNWISVLPLQADVPEEERWWIMYAQIMMMQQTIRCWGSRLSFAAMCDCHRSRREDRQREYSWCGQTRPSPWWTLHWLVLTLISVQVGALNIQATSGDLCPPKCVNRSKSHLGFLEHAKKNVDSVIDLFHAAWFLFFASPVWFPLKSLMSGDTKGVRQPHK